MRIVSNETMAGYVSASSTQLSGQGGRSTRKQGLFPPRHGCNKSFKQQVFVALVEGVGEAVCLVWKACARHGAGRHGTLADEAVEPGLLGGQVRGSEGMHFLRRPKA